MSHPTPLIGRRDFLRTTSAVAGAVALAGRAAAADDPFGGFTVGIQSYTFRKFDLEQALKQI